MSTSSFGAGTDFERKIVVAPDSPRYCARPLSVHRGAASFFVFSGGVTDCYQPLEASYRLTRACPEAACAEYRKPVAIIARRRSSSATSTC